MFFREKQQKTQDIRKNVKDAIVVGLMWITALTDPQVVRTPSDTLVPAVVHLKCLMTLDKVLVLHYEEHHVFFFHLMDLVQNLMQVR